MNARLNTIVCVTMIGIHMTNALIAWCAKYIENRTAAPTAATTPTAAIAPTAATAPTAGTKRLLPSLPLPQHKRNKPHKQQGASAPDPLTGPNSSRCFNLAYYISILISLQANISSAVAPLPAQHAQSDVHEQYQQPSQNNVSLSVCDGFNRDDMYDTDGRAKGNTLPQSFNSSMQETQGSVLHRGEPIRESSNAIPSSFPTDPQRHQGQEHINQHNLEANNLMGTDEQGQTHQMRLDGGQNGMCTALNKLDIAFMYKLRAIYRHRIFHRQQQTMLLIVSGNFLRLDGILIRAENERYHPAATSQPFQDTSSEQLHRFGTGNTMPQLDQMFYH